MDLPIRPKPCNAHKPRIRIVERRETVYESWQPEFIGEARPDGTVVAKPTGQYTYGMTFAQLSGAMKHAPNGTVGRASRAVEEATA